MTTQLKDSDIHAPQDWQRDRREPCISLGKAGDFDDTHILAPCVAVENGVYRMWYCGSRGAVANRRYELGLATSTDGVHFTKHSGSPVLAFADGRSVLTPTLLRHSDGSLCREDGRLRMWFSATDFGAGGERHTLHEATSVDGIDWSPPGPVQLENLYAPTVLKEGGKYLLWYTDVAKEPWCFRHAVSDDGKQWQVLPEPVMQVEQAWEKGRLFYPTVIRLGERYAMWYGSYHRQKKDPQTALGFAVSDDGIHWTKNPSNPVFGPEPTNVWESHYTTSQSIAVLPDGGLRIWYAARTKPPFVHKYLAIGTAHLRSGGL